MAHTFKYVVTEGVAIAGTAKTRREAEAIAKDSKGYYVASGFNVWGNLKNGYTVDKERADDMGDIDIFIMTVAEFCDYAYKRELDNMLTHLNVESAVYYRYKSSGDRWFTHDATNAEIVKFIAAYAKTGIIPLRSVWRNSTAH